MSSLALAHSHSGENVTFLCHKHYLFPILPLHMSPVTSFHRDPKALEQGGHQSQLPETPRQRLKESFTVLAALGFSSSHS